MKDKYRRDLGERLRIAREYLELTQEQVAKIMNVGRDAIIRIEKGTRKVSTEELVKFSKLYRISIEDLLKKKTKTIIQSKLLH